MTLLSMGSKTEIVQARLELERAWGIFHNADPYNHRFIDSAIYQVMAAEEKYKALLGHMKRMA